MRAVGQAQVRVGFVLRDAEARGYCDNKQHLGTVRVCLLTYLWADRSASKRRCRLRACGARPNLNSPQLPKMKSVEKKLEKAPRGDLKVKFRGCCAFLSDPSVASRGDSPKRERNHAHHGVAGCAELGIAGSNVLRSRIQHSACACGAPLTQHCHVREW